MDKENNLTKTENAAPVTQGGIVIETELERLHRDIYRPDMEKLQLFTKMLRDNAVYKRAKITHR